MEKKDKERKKKVFDKINDFTWCFSEIGPAFYFYFKDPCKKTKLHLEDLLSSYSEDVIKMLTKAYGIKGTKATDFMCDMRGIALENIDHLFKEIWSEIISRKKKK